MTKELKAAILEIIEITKTVPEPLQLRCFEILLNDHLAREHTPSKKPVTAAPPEDGPTKAPPQNKDEVKSPKQSDIQVADLHVKARRFLEKYNLSVADLNEVFFKEGDTFKPLFDDLKTSKLAESQIRIALLEAVKAAMRNGEFQFDGEIVRAECQIRKCYDATNYSANFKNNSDLFDGFEGYKKTAPTIRLSETGRKTLAELITELKN